MADIGILADDHLTEAEVAKILKIKANTLVQRIYSGTEHPPFIEIARGERIYPKALFRAWVAGKKVIWEVKSAS